jgi:hypothetical protein
MKPKNASSLKSKEVTNPVAIEDSASLILKFPHKTTKWELND